jgi:hypothetical protein
VLNLEFFKLHSPRKGKEVECEERFELKSRAEETTAGAEEYSSGRDV